MAIDYLVDERMPGKLRQPGNSIIDLAAIAREMRPERDGIRQSYVQPRDPTPALDQTALYVGGAKTPPPYKSNELPRQANSYMTAREALYKLLML